ncbi:hypothetical protein L596_002493 [Steinernema carpocapsae]|uniref:PH domain-containing protein n=1 Tax=Steinernema carpocapsae TaxID=34508 RepID=A0A4U8UPR7_STECR|nr:hypothetical protein L596_002493 [Steinernema carpocapsae]
MRRQQSSSFAVVVVALVFVADLHSRRPVTSAPNHITAYNLRGTSDRFRKALPVPSYLLPMSPSSSRRRRRCLYQARGLAASGVTVQHGQQLNHRTRLPSSGCRFGFALRRPPGVFDSSANTYVCFGPSFAFFEIETTATNPPVFYRPSSPYLKRRTGEANSLSGSAPKWTFSADWGCHRFDTNLFRMHPLLLGVLQQRDFHSAGELYNISHYDIITDLHSALVKVKQIFCDITYIDSTNDQKVVEIVLGCITTAIRETNCMETYAAGLVDVLEACLSHRMYRMNSTGQIQDTPHCKIASDLLGSLFLFYAKKSVMTVTIPVAIKALNCGNVELARNTTSYLSLAAIHNGRILAQFAIQIISNIMNGNYALVRVLPQVYQENREPFHAHLPQIFKLLHHSDSDISEKLSLLQLASSVANTKPDLIIPHLSDFEEFLRNPSTCTAVLHIFLSLISMNRSNSLIDQLSPLRSAARSTHCQNNLATIAKVVGVIGRINDRLATIAVHDLLDLCQKSNTSNLPILLKEVEGVAEKFPASVAVHLETIQDVCDRQSTTQKSWLRIRALCMEENRNKSRHFESATPDEVTIIPVVGNDDRSQDSLDNYKRISYISDAPIISSGIRTTVDVSDSYLNNPREIEFDRDMRSMVDFYNRNRPDYENRSRASLTPSNGTRTTANANDSILDTSRLTDIDRDLRTVLEWSKQKNLLEQSDTRSRNSFALNTPNNRSQNENITIVETPLSASKRSVQSNYSQIRPPPSYQPPKENSLSVPSPTPFSHTAVQIGKDGRVRPISMNNRRYPNWIPSTNSLTSYETTFPANCGPVTTTKVESRSGSATHILNGEQPSSLNGCQSTVDMETATRSSRANSDWTNDFERGDVVKQFVEHRRSKIRRFISELAVKYPIPIQCTVEGSKGSKHRMRVHLACQMRDSHCLYDGESMFAFKTHIAPTWLHLMFLQMEVMSMENDGPVLCQNSEQFKTLNHCWECLPSVCTKNRPFVTLVTSAFPGLKDQAQMLKELQDSRYFDSFSYNAQKKMWCCFSCNHPERVRSILRPDNSPLLEGQLKEKRGRWRFLKRWHTKYFTLSSAALTCTGESSCSAATDRMICPSIDLRKIRSVKSLSRGRKSRKNLPRAFEIFTDDDRSYVLKASDQNKAEEWFQCLQIAVAQAHRETATA